MRPEQKIRRHGYHLMSLASLGLALAAALGMVISLLVWLPGSAPSPVTWSLFDTPWEEVVAMAPHARAVLVVAVLVLTLSWLLPLLALRRLGKALYLHEALSPQVASAFMLLAHSLPAWLLLSLCSWALVAVARSSGGELTLSFSISTTAYFFIVACLCLYSVAHLMRLAVQAAEDARNFV